MPTTTQNLATARHSSKTTHADKGEKLVLTLSEEVTAKLVVGKSEHKSVKLPVGDYELVQYSEHTEYAGSDYCWVSYNTDAWIRATKGDTDRIYEVAVSQGGDASKFSRGSISVVKE